MKEKEITVKTTEIKTFKARIKATRPHWVGKAISHRHTIQDGINPHFKTYLTAFMPKLTQSQRTPVAMLHMTNGAGSCLLRAADPLKLASDLEHMADILRSDIWLDMFQQLQDISENLIMGNVVLDDLFVDVATFRKKAGLKKGESFPFIEITE